MTSEESIPMPVNLGSSTESIGCIDEIATHCSKILCAQMCQSCASVPGDFSVVWGDVQKFV